MYKLFLLLVIIKFSSSFDTSHFGESANICSKLKFKIFKVCERDNQGPIWYDVPFYYPYTWNQNLDPPVYAPNQMCTWTISNPMGLYAIFTMKAYIGGDNSLMIADCNGNTEV